MLAASSRDSPRRQLDFTGGGGPSAPPPPPPPLMEQQGGPIHLSVLTSAAGPSGPVSPGSGLVSPPRSPRSRILSSSDSWGSAEPSSHLAKAQRQHRPTTPRKPKPASPDRRPPLAASAEQLVPPPSPRKAPLAHCPLGGPPSHRVDAHFPADDTATASAAACCYGSPPLAAAAGSHHGTPWGSGAGPHGMAAGPGRATTPHQHSGGSPTASSPATSAFLMCGDGGSVIGHSSYAAATGSLSPHAAQPLSPRRQHPFPLAAAAAANGGTYSSSPLAAVPFADYLAASQAAAAVILSSPHAAGRSEADLVAEIAEATTAGMATYASYHASPVAGGVALSAASSPFMPHAHPPLLMCAIASPRGAAAAAGPQSPFRRLFQNGGSSDNHGGGDGSAFAPHPALTPAPVPASSPTSARASSCRRLFHEGAGGSEAINAVASSSNGEAGGTVAAAGMQQRLWGAPATAVGSSGNGSVPSRSPPASPGAGHRGGLEGLEHLTTRALKVPHSPGSSSIFSDGAAGPSSSSSSVTAAMLPSSGGGSSYGVTDNSGGGGGGSGLRGCLSLQQRVLLRQHQQHYSSLPLPASGGSAAEGSGATHPLRGGEENLPSAELLLLQASSAPLSPRSSLYQELQDIKQQLQVGGWDCGRSPRPRRPDPITSLRMDVYVFH